MYVAASIKFFTELSKVINANNEDFKKFKYFIDRVNPRKNKKIRSKVINSFKMFCEKNNDAIMSQTLEKFNCEIHYSENLHLDMKEIIESVEDDNKTNIWNYILSISSQIAPDATKDDLIKSLKNKKTSSKEVDIDKLFETVQSKFKTANNNPMKMIGSLMKDSNIKNLISSFKSGGKINIRKIIELLEKMIQRLKANLPEELDTKDVNVQDMMKNMGNVMKSNPIDLTKDIDSDFKNDIKKMSKEIVDLVDEVTDDTKA